MIHKYKQLGLNIVMDVYSGAVHVVDDVMYDMLDYTLEPFMAEAKCPDYIKEGLKDKSVSYTHLTLPTNRKV